MKQQKEEIEANAAAVAPAAASSSSASAPLPASSSSSNTPVPASSCRSCNASFRSADEQHAHYKSSWHWYDALFPLLFFLLLVCLLRLSSPSHISIASLVIVSHGSYHNAWVLSAIIGSVSHLFLSCSTRHSIVFSFVFLSPMLVEIFSLNVNSFQKTTFGAHSRSRLLFVFFSPPPFLFSLFSSLLFYSHNLKRKLSGLTSITQLEFHELSASGDISSESESEKEKSGDEGENEKRTARRKNRQLQKQQQQKKSSTEQKLQRDQESDEDEDAEDDEAELSDGSEDEEGISKKGNNAEGDEEEQSHPLTRRSPQLSFLLRSNANNNTLNNVASSSSSSSSSSPSTSNNSSNNNCYVVTVFRSLLGEAEKNFTAAQVEQFYKEQFSALLKQSLSVQPVWVIFMCQGRKRREKKEKLKS